MQITAIFKAQKVSFQCHKNSCYLFI